VWREKYEAEVDTVTGQTIRYGNVDEVARAYDDPLEAPFPLAFLLVWVAAQVVSVCAGFCGPGRAFAETREI
jgi:hypothetical protein